MSKLLIFVIFIVIILFILIVLTNFSTTFTEGIQKITIPSDSILKEGFTVNKIPKIIWGYWNTGIQNAPETVKKCIENWKRFNIGWTINILNDNNLQDYVDPTIFSKIVVKKSYTHKKSDLIRLLLLQKYGGIWVDASIFFTESLDWVLKLQKDKNVDIVCYYLKRFTTDKKFPVLENWFIASTPNNEFLNLWLMDFVFYLYNDYKIYMKTVKALNINTQNIDVPPYLTMHVSAQKIMQKHPHLLSRIFAMSAEDDPFKYHCQYKWKMEKAFDDLMFQNHNEAVPKLVKMTGMHRRIVEKLLLTKSVNKNSLFGKYVFTEE